MISCIKNIFVLCKSVKELFLFIWLFMGNQKIYFQYSIQLWKSDGKEFISYQEHRIKKTVL